MACLPTLALSGRACRQRGVGALLLALALTTGCVSTSMSTWSNEGPPPPGNAYQVVCTWQNNVMYTPDPTRGGTPTPGFAGRVYLFGPNIDYPVVGDGGLQVDLIDESGNQPAHVERWTLDGDTLKRLLKKDVLGWGYTVFLPSGRYRPEMNKIRLRASFQPVKGTPIYTENAVTLAASNGVLRESSSPLQRVVPGQKGMTPTPAPASPKLPSPILVK